ncbi:MAG TPA: sulfatase, partial [Armatimonadota bacterium]|nr:sulfatase [Armatimonadota bacterium]
MKRPNIFIYMMDTQRSANMSCYGYRRQTSPSIDAIAADGCLFENHFTNSMWSLPSQASLFTGKYLCGHGCGDQYQFMEDDFPTLAEALSGAGYLTGAIQPNPWVQQDSGNVGRGFTEWINPRDAEAVPPYTPEEADGSFVPAWKNVGLIEKWLDDHAGDDRPWLLFALSSEPHMKYAPPEPWLSEFLEPGISPEDALAIPQSQFSGTAGEIVLTADQWAVVRSLRDGATASVDHAIGEIYRNFAGRGLLDNTLFVVTSDHGDSQGEHGFHTAHCQTALWDT